MKMKKDLHLIHGLMDHYSACYKDRYGRPPLDFTPVDEAALAHVLQRVGDFDMAKDMIGAYLSLSGQRPDDNWFKEQGHDLVTFKNKVSFIFAYTSNQKTDSPKYVVGFTAKGFPVTSKEPKSAIRGFVPTEYDKWIRRPTDEKYVLPKSRWVKSGIDVSMWEQTWKQIMVDLKASRL